jgi:4-hydroxybenzoate polyprenyltransferase
MSLIPEEVFKRRRRHNNTPESILLIIANYIVTCLAISLFAYKGHINWLFWVVVGLLAVYNFFTIRRNKEEFIRPVVITYVISNIVLVAMLFLFIAKS